MLTSDFSSFKKSVSNGIIVRVFMKILNLALDMLYLNRISSKVLGAANVRLGLLHNTLVGLVRDPFRKSLVTERYSKELLRLSLFCPGIGLGLGLIFVVFWLYVLGIPGESLEKSEYLFAVVVFALSAWLEICNEPMYLFLKTNDFIYTISLIDVVSQLTHIVIMLRILFKNSTIGIYDVCLLHFSRFFAMWISFIVATFMNVDTFRKVKYGAQDKSELIKSYFFQNIFHIFSNQGENFLINIIPWLKFGELGVYSIVFNLGSIIPHIFFAPIEESLYILCGRRSTDSIAQKRNFFATTFHSIQRVMLYFGCFAFIYGQMLSGIFFKIFFSSSTHSIDLLSQLMQQFATYILFLAINGPLEAFVYSSLNAKDVYKSTKTLVMVSGVHFSSLILLTTRLGVAGILYSNILVYCVRIYIS
ncbi:Protein RFT1 [Thelohanellus kitauei]|uniref:Protein RFT1 homolog n=1 Tax=Thelohanellus kitauei TaxID=669202 RepID=A0A0C2JBA6_THEKT|nr:Protein RFT1 [Thelohanellus kitauei]